jgi:hypothetical protein
MVNYEVAFKKPFTDVSKLIIGILLSVVPIVQWIAFGFILECSGVGKAKESKDMPEWDNWGKLFSNGLLATTIQVIYFIPAIVVIVIGAGTMIIGMLSVLFGAVPSQMMQGLMANDPAAQAAFADFARNNWQALMPWILTFLPFLIVGLILALIASYISPIAVLNFFKSGKFSDGFALGAISKKAFTSNYFAVWLVVMVIALVASMILGWIPWIGRAIIYFTVGVFSYTMYGQVYKMK